MWRLGCGVLASILFSTLAFAGATPDVVLKVKKDGQIYDIGTSHRRGSANILDVLNFGNVPLGISLIFTFQMGPCCSDQTYGSPSLSGDPDFAITRNACAGLTLSAGQTCEFDLTFTPTSTGTKTGSFTFPFTNIVNGAPVSGGAVSYSLTGYSLDKPEQCPIIAQGSIIDIGKQGLKEVVPIVGTDFLLHYSSEFAPEYSSANQSLSTVTARYSYNLEGWTHSLHHLYSKAQSRLFLGTGEVQEAKSISQADGNLLVVHPNGGEVYVFSVDGKHLETRSGLTGSLRYTFGYDANDRLVTITDAFGNQTTFIRNANGLMTSIRAPYGQVTSFTHTSDGLIASVSNPNNETYLLTYKTGTHLLETFMKPGGQTSIFTYDTNGKLTKDLGHGGNYWEIVTGAGGAITKSSQMSRATNYSVSRDTGGNLSRNEISPFGLVTTYQESAFGDSITVLPFQWSQRTVVNDERFGDTLKRPASETLNLNGVSRIVTYAQNISYPSGVTPGLFNFAKITKTSTTDGKITTEVFDNVTKTMTTTSPAGAKTSVVLNLQEQPISMQTGSDTPITLTYDALGRLKSTVQGSVNQKTFVYNSNGFLQSVTNALGEVTSYTYDLAGRVTTTTMPDGRATHHSYDANGNVTGVQPPSRPFHLFTFNAFELPAEYNPPPLSGVSVVNTRYTYNMDKQLTQITRPTGATAVFNYNLTTGLLSSIGLAGGANTYTYEPNSDRVVRIDSADGIRNDYTHFGRNIQTVEQKNASTNFVYGKIIYTYDSQHRIVNRRVYGNNFGVAYDQAITYNSDSQPTQIGPMSLAYTFPSGRLATTVTNQISDSRTYDAYGNLETYSAVYTPIKGKAVLLYSYTLTRDALHRIVAKSETIQKDKYKYTYSYDSAGRLTKVFRNNKAYSSYIYDDNGNRVMGTTAGVQFTATYDAQDRMLTHGPRSYTYNANGERTSVSQLLTLPQEYTYDAFGNTKSLKLANGTLVSYGYDGENHNTVLSVGGAVNQRTIYENDYRIAMRVIGAGVAYEIYSYGTRINTPDLVFKNGAFYRIIADHLGSPRLVVQATDGVVAQRMEYNDLGGITQDTAPDFQAYGFAGGLNLPFAGLTKFGARLYDAETGTWTTKDPIGFDGGDTNLFGYVANDPINFVDPEGTNPLIIAGLIVGAILTPTPTDTHISTIEEGARVMGGAAAGAAVGGMCSMAATGAEVTIGGIRLAPFGNRTGNPTGELPHYHRRVIDPMTSEPAPGQGIGRHRPWDTRSTDTSFWDRF